MYQLFQCMVVKLVVNMVYTKVCLIVLDYLTYIHIIVAPRTRCTFLRLDSITYICFFATIKTYCAFDVV